MAYPGLKTKNSRPPGPIPDEFDEIMARWANQATLEAPATLISNEGFSLHESPKMFTRTPTGKRHSK